MTTDIMVVFRLVTGNNINHVMEIAEAGDEAARSFIMAFNAWNDRTRRERPVCFACGCKIYDAKSKSANFGGIGMAHPEGDHTTSLMAAFCRKCGRMDPGLLRYVFMNGVAAEWTDHMGHYH